MDRIVLKPEREKSLLRFHPWIFSGAVGRVEGSPDGGATVEVCSAAGEFLAYAAYSPLSQIRARVWSWNRDEAVDEAFFRRRLQQALELRAALAGSGQTNALRLVHAESDNLPGVIVDRYAGALVLQCLTAGAARWRDTLTHLLAELTGCQSIYERSDADVRQLEGLPTAVGPLFGPQPASALEIEENGLRFQVDLRSGQKTGFFLDQRDNRQRLRALCAGRSVLNCFCYTGAFTIYALAGGASRVLSIDTSHEALTLGKLNINLNGLDAGKAEWMEADVFQALRGLRDRRASYDLIILDPPKFAPTAAQAEKAARGYKDINLLAFKLLRPGGLLLTFSCSGGISEDLFQKIVAGAALDAGVHAAMVGRLSQAADHPVALNVPEGAYLKGLVCRVNGPLRG